MLLRAVEDHYNLRQTMPNQKSQISVELSDSGKCCLVYREDTVTNGGIKDMRCECKVVWVYPSSNVTRCPVCLTLKYLSLCPRYIRKPNFYLRSLEKLTPTTGYAEQLVSAHTLSKVIIKLMYKAEIQGFFTNHSAHRTGSTRLFRAGLTVKLSRNVQVTGLTLLTNTKLQVMHNVKMYLIQLVRIQMSQNRRKLLCQNAIMPVEP